MALHGCRSRNHVSHITVLLCGSEDTLPLRIPTLHTIRVGHCVAVRALRVVNIIVNNA